MYLKQTFYNTEFMRHRVSGFKDAVKQLKENVFNDDGFRFAHIIKYDPSIEEIANQWRSRFKHFVIVGMGGAALNPKSVLSFMQQDNFTFFDTTDPYFIYPALERLDLTNTAFIVISKSGETLETIANFLCIKAMLEKYKKSIDEHVVFIIGDNQSKLAKLARMYKIRIIEHPNDIGGRFAAFTNVCFFPMLLAGLDVKQFIRGGRFMADDFKLHRSKSLAAQGAAFIYNEYITNSISLYVTMPYLERLHTYNRLKTQLLAESLGKSKNTVEPYYSIGPQDQHSCAQLYIAGPKNKTFNLIFHDEPGNYKPQSLEQLQINNLAGPHLHEILKMEYECMRNQLVIDFFPVRTIHLKDLSLETFGALTMFTIYEVLMLAHALNIDALGQPAVENMKKNISISLK